MPRPPTSPIEPTPRPAEPSTAQAALAGAGAGAGAGVGAGGPESAGSQPAGLPERYEEAAAELESIIDRIESGEIGLEESVRAYERGAALVRRCRAILERAEQRIEELDTREPTDPGPA